MKLKLFLLVFTVFTYSVISAKQLIVTSPNKQIVVKINCSEDIRFDLTYKAVNLIQPSPISITLADGTILGKKPIVSGNKQSSNSDNIVNEIYRKKKIENNYNELLINFKGNYNLVFRVFNDGFAYRFITSLQGKIKIKSEESSFLFTSADTVKVWQIEKESTFNDGEGLYSKTTISQMNPLKIALTPLLVKSNNTNMLLFESDIFDYPKMFIQKDANNVNGLRATFSKQMSSEIHKGWTWNVTGYHDFIAETDGTRSFPWRCMMVTDNDAALVDCDMVYRLATPPSGDYSWVKPGKAAWDWWYDWNIEGVDFKGEMASNDFYKYVIDFAAENKIEYIEVSVGWSNDDWIITPSPTLDMKILMEYAKSKNVGVLLWVCANRLMENYEKAFALFEELKPAGLKVDFMDGDHQTRMTYYEKISKECANRKLMVYFHGAHTPAGMQVTFPNVINYEAVRGNEYNKWSTDNSPEHDVTLPFIRNAVGPMDYTPGGMINVTKNDFRVSNECPMVKGTRCHQLAMYVVYFGPTQMICDAPSHYMKNQESLDLITQIPTVWDYSIPIDGKIGEYVIIARKKNDNWFVGGMSDWSSRDIKLNFNFLDKNIQYKATVYKDGINADRFATDYKIEKFNINSESILNIHIAQGGGFVIKIEK